MDVRKRHNDRRGVLWGRGKNPEKSTQNRPPPKHPARWTVENRAYRTRDKGRLRNPTNGFQIREKIAWDHLLNEWHFTELCPNTEGRFDKEKR